MKISARTLAWSLALALACGGAYATGCPVKAAIMIAVATFTALSATGFVTGKLAWIIGSSLGVIAGAYVLYPYVKDYGDFHPKTWGSAASNQAAARATSAFSIAQPQVNTDSVHLAQKTIVWILQQSQETDPHERLWYLIRHDSEVQRSTAQMPIHMNEAKGLIFQNPQLAWGSSETDPSGVLFIDDIDACTHTLRCYVISPSAGTAIPFAEYRMGEPFNILSIAYTPEAAVALVHLLGSRGEQEVADYVLYIPRFGINEDPRKLIVPNDIEANDSGRILGFPPGMITGATTLQVAKAISNAENCTESVITVNVEIAAPLGFPLAQRTKLFWTDSQYGMHQWMVDANETLHMRGSLEAVVGMLFTDLHSVNIEIYPSQADPGVVYATLAASHSPTYYIRVDLEGDRVSFIKGIPRLPGTIAIGQAAY